MKSKLSGASTEPVENRVLRPERSNSIARPDTGLFQRGYVLRATTECRYFLRLGHAPENASVFMKWRSVVENNGRSGRQPTNQPVPHHPAARRKEEEPVVCIDIAVKHVFFEVLNQGATGSVNDTFWYTSGAGRIHDVEGMIEFGRRALELSTWDDKFLPTHAPSNIARLEGFASEWHYHCFFDAS